MRHRVCTGPDRALHRQFRLGVWMKKSRRDYFVFCDQVGPHLAWLIGTEAPTPQSLLPFVIAAVESDESFADFVLARDATVLTQRETWVDLYRAGAASILDEYFAAVENGTWP
jgi:hypothetical protein